jgi:hypothetical protein
MNQADKTRRLNSARQCGEETAARFGFKELPVNPFEIAKQSDIRVEAKPDTAAGVSGMLLRHGDNFGIMYATHITSEGFQRFSVGHELGHYFLEGHMDHVLPDGDGFHTSHAGFTSSDIYELEADHFAAGLLMPGNLFKAALNRLNDDMAAIERLATLCGTSLTATAIRFAQTTGGAAIIIVSTGKTIDYAFLSDTLCENRSLEWPKKGTALPARSATVGFNQESANISASRRESSATDLSHWVGGVAAAGREEVIGLGRYGKTLTLITCSHAYPTEDEAEDEESNSQPWGPRFHR